jgi:hypothetical protein
MTITAEMTFSEAASVWLDMRDPGTSRARYLRPRAIKTYRLELSRPPAAISHDGAATYGR